MDYFSSDHHFCHKNIIKYTGRPYSCVEDMNSDIIQKHNSVVEPDDVWHCIGDFAFANIKKQTELLASLNGKKKILYLGNHDRSPSVMLDIGFDEVYRHSVDYEYAGIKFRISHYPFCPEEQAGFIPKYKNRRPLVEGCDWLICGHTHEKWKILRNMVNLSVDVWNFYPTSIETIVQTVENAGIVIDLEKLNNIYCY